MSPPFDVAIVVRHMAAIFYLSALASALHLLSLAFGVALLLLRERALGAPLDTAGVRNVLRYDTASGVVILVWMGTGLVRLFGGLEKGTSYYLASPLFWAKMALFALAWSCEAPSMATFLKWRRHLARGAEIDLSRVPLLRRMHWLQLSCLVAIVLVASLMARGGGGAATSSHASSAGLGALVYQAKCSACHRSDGRGDGGRLAADFVGDPTRLAKGDAALLRSIAEGIPGTAMRAFRAETTDDERRAALAYIRERFGEQPRNRPGASPSAEGRN